MKIVRGILAFLLSCLLFMVIFILSISVVFNESVKKNLLPEIVREAIIKNIDNNNQVSSDVVREKMTTFTELDGFDELINVGIDEIIECKKDKRGISDKAVDTFIDFIKKNKSKYQEIFEIELSDEQMEAPEFRDSIKSFFSEQINNLDIPVDNNTYTIIQTYKKFTTRKYQIYLIITGILLIILLAIVRWSWYKWLKDVSVPLIFSGINIGLTFIAFTFLESFLKNNYNISINIVSNTLIAMIIGEIVIGIVIYVIYKIIDSKHEES